MYFQLAHQQSRPLSIQLSLERLRYFLFESVLRGAVAERFLCPVWGARGVCPEQNTPMGKGFVRLLGIDRLWRRLYLCLLSCLRNNLGNALP